MHVSGTDLRVATDEVDTALYRIAQEGLNNVAKHARARSVSVLLESDSDYTSLLRGELLYSRGNFVTKALAVQWAKQARAAMEAV